MIKWYLGTALAAAVVIFAMFAGQSIVSIKVDGSWNVFRTSSVRYLERQVISAFQKCGVDQVAPIDKVRITFQSIPRSNPYILTCAYAEVGGERIYLNSDMSLFGPDKRCGSLYSVLGHETLHLYGARHTSKDQARTFEALLNYCGFGK